MIRGDTGNQMPTDPADRMFIAIRAHGNASEYVPTLCRPDRSSARPSPTAGGSTSWPSRALVARALHAFGMLTVQDLAAHGPLRDTGALGTYLTGVLLGVTALVAL